MIPSPPGVQQDLSGSLQSQDRCWRTRRRLLLADVNPVRRRPGRPRTKNKAASTATSSKVATPRLAAAAKVLGGVGPSLTDILDTGVNGGEQWFSKGNRKVRLLSVFKLCQLRT